MLVEPWRNQISSCAIAPKATFLVVTRGNPSLRSNRIWRPNTLSASIFAPVERSTARVGFRVPWVRTSRKSSRYCLIRQGAHTVSMEKTITIDDARIIRP